MCGERISGPRLSHRVSGGIMRLLSGKCQRPLVRRAPAADECGARGLSAASHKAQGGRHARCPCCRGLESPNGPHPGPWRILRRGPKGSRLYFQPLLKPFLLWQPNYFFLAVLGCFCPRAFSSCGERRLPFVAVHGLHIAVVSPVVEDRL